MSFLIDAFGPLKNSDLYEPPEKLKEKLTAGPSSRAVRPNTSKSNPILVSPRQVSFFYISLCYFILSISTLQLWSFKFLKFLGF